MLRRFASWVGLLSAALVVALPADAATSLVMLDGRVLEVSGIERSGELYLIELGQERLAIPTKLVAEIRIVGNEDPAASGFEEATGRTLVGPPKAEELPDLDTQLAAFEAGPAKFQPGVINPTWYPSTDWNFDPSNNDFHPVQWYQPPIDPVWVPYSAFRRSGDVTQFHPVTWYRPPIDAIWWPQDGFATSVSRAGQGQ